LKKRFDPLWEIVDEKVSLQGSGGTKTMKCPQCHVTLDLPARLRAGDPFDCGLCGARCEFSADMLVADDGTAKPAAHLAK
jgi:hypothetical protein